MGTHARDRELGALQRFDEVNLSQHSLISLKERVTREDLNWNVNYTINGRQYQVTCRGLPDYGSPHGIDTDVSAAIINLYIEQGCADDDSISVTAYHLLKSAGLHINGQNYKSLRESLMRLEGTQYVISRSWRDAERGRWTNTTFRYLDKVEYTGKEVGEVDAKSVIRITLPRDVGASIRAGYLKPLDLPFMQSLRRPPTRALYRLLDAQRTDPEHPDRRIGSLEVGLMDWAKACKIISDRPDMIRRMLEPAHKELVDRGVLKSVEYVGRGKKQYICYVFGEVAAPPDPRIVGLLVSHGVSRPTAEKLAREQRVEVIEKEVAVCTALIHNGYKPRRKAAMMVDAVQNPGKYKPPEGLPDPQQAAAAEKERAVREEERAASRKLEDERTAMERISPEERAERNFKTIQLYVGKQLTLMEFDVLRTALVEEKLNGDEISRTLTAAAAKNLLAEVIKDLRATLAVL